MNVQQLIEKLKALDPELPVWVGIGCSCYGTAELNNVDVQKADRFRDHDIVFLEE